jgi:subtilisin-like proprotein convertase family protein
MGRTIAVGAALAALAVGGMTMTDRALSAAPGAPPICVAPVAKTFSKTGVALIPDSGSVSSSITVSGASPVLRDVDLKTLITHTHTGDLRLTLTHNGKTVLIKDQTSAAGPVPGAAAAWDDLWNGTVWDDGAGHDRVASDFNFTDNGVVTPLVPQTPLGRFIGDDPNGVWTLTIEDTDNGDTGALNGWSLDIAGLEVAPPLTSTTQASTLTAAPIPDNDPNGVSKTITVTGAKSYLWDLNLQTFITHGASGDLDVTLTHLGRTVTITTGNGGPDVDVFNGTKWDDSATSGVIAFTNANSNAGSATIAPEEALAAFAGMNPNGAWVLKVVDHAALDTGSLNSWNLTIQSTDGCTAVVTPPVDPPVVPPVTPPVVLPPVTPPVVITKLAPRGLGVALSTTRDAVAPFAFSVTGKLTPPVGSTICAGKVAVTVKAGKKVVSSKTVSLRKSGAACTYKAAFSFKSKPKALPKSGTVTVSSRFLGTAAFTARASKVASIRLG